MPLLDVEFQMVKSDDHSRMREVRVDAVTVESSLCPKQRYSNGIRPSIGPRPPVCGWQWRWN